MELYKWEYVVPLDKDSWYKYGLVVLTTPMVLTQIHGIIMLLARTHGRDMDSLYWQGFIVYGRNQSQCEKAKNVGFLPFILLVLLTIYIFVALMKINMCFTKLEASHIMSWDS